MRHNQPTDQSVMRASRLHQLDQMRCHIARHRRDKLGSNATTSRSASLPMPTHTRVCIVPMHPPHFSYASRRAMRLHKETTDQKVVQASRYTSVQIRCGFTSRSTALCRSNS